MKEFLGTWYGLTAFIVFDALVLFAIIAVNYRWFFKRFFDALFSLVALVACALPMLALTIAVAVHNAKENEYEGIFQKEYIIGKNGKPVCLHYFSYRNALDSSVSSFGKKIKPFARLPYLLAVFLGKLSFIGTQRMQLFNESLITDEDYERFKVRPGLINHLIVRGKNETRSYEKMFRADRIYVKKVNIFLDLRIFFTWLVLKIRGVKENRVGVAETQTYADNLLQEKAITQEEYDLALADEEKILERAKKRRNFVHEMANHGDE